MMIIIVIYCIYTEGEVNDWFYSINLLITILNPAIWSNKINKIETVTKYLLQSEGHHADHDEAGARDGEAVGDLLHHEGLHDVGEDDLHGPEDGHSGGGDESQGPSEGEVTQQTHQAEHHEERPGEVLDVWDVEHDLGLLVEACADESNEDSTQPRPEDEDLGGDSLAP